jgi:signal transduction histidine kinase
LGEAETVQALTLRSETTQTNRRRMSGGRLAVLNFAAVLGLVLLASLTPAGVLLGALACVPILLSALADDRRIVFGVGALAMVGVGAIALAEGLTGVPPVFWHHERLVAWLTLPAALTLALGLQYRRLQAFAGRDAALSASEMNRLLMSLLAHDLRSPLALADQGFQYVEESTLGGYPIDRAVVADVRARLHRSLRAIEMVLTLARSESNGNGARQGKGGRAPVRLRDEITAEVTSFQYEAEARGKRLLADLEGVGLGAYHVNALVLRQALAILLDNAVRYADAGPIRVSAHVARTVLELRVEDTGPGLSTHRSGAAQAGGSGLGLRLSSALLARAGGSLRIERDAPDGTCLAIRLPVSSAAGQAYAESSPTSEPS